MNFIFLKLFEWADIYIPNKLQADLCFYNQFRDSIEFYETDTLTVETSMGQSKFDLIKTGHAKVYLDVLRTLLKKEENYPILIKGPSGSGKRYERYF